MRRSGSCSWTWMWERVKDDSPNVEFCEAGCSRSGFVGEGRLDVRCRNGDGNVHGTIGPVSDLLAKS